MLDKKMPKKGDEIILIKSSASSGASILEGKILLVQSFFGNIGNNPYVSVSDKENPSLSMWNIFLEKDEWIFATREHKIDFLNKKIKGIEAILNEAKEELDYYSKYSSEEEYYDDQIQKMIKPDSSKEERLKIIKMLTERLRK